MKFVSALSDADRTALEQAHREGGARLHAGATGRPLPDQPRRQDSEYVREGTANLFLLSAPLLGWRHVEVTERRTCRDFASVLRGLVDVHFRRPRRSCW